MVSQPTGLIRASVPVDFTLLYLSDILTDFLRHYPGIRLDLDVSPRQSSLISDGVDLVIRLGTPKEPNLIGRKLGGSKGQLVRKYIDQAEAFCAAHKSDANVAPFITVLEEHLKEWWELSELMLARGKEDPNFSASAAVDYQEYSGYVVLAYLWARMAAVASAKLAALMLGTSRFSA